MQRDRWSLNLLAREAVRNVFARRSRVFPLLMVSVLLGTAAVLFMTYEANALSLRLASLDQNGRSVVIFASAEADNRVLVRRDTCERLTGTPGVLRAGLLRLGTSAVVVQLGREVPVVEASTSLFPDLGAHQAIVGSALVRPAETATVSTSAGMMVALPGAPQPAGIDTNSALVVALDPTVNEGSACYLVMAPYAAPSELIPVTSAQLSVNGPAIVGKQVSRQSLDPIALFRDRPSQFLPLGVGLVGAVLAGSRNLLRAGEFSTYRLSGTSPRSLAAIIWFEQALVAGAGQAAGIATIAATSQYLLSPAAAFGWLGACFTGWLVGACLLSLPVITHSAVALAKDR